MRLAVSILAMAAVCLSCKKDNSGPTEKVEIYLLKTFQTVSGKCQVDALTSVLEDSPTIKNEDILKYSENEYEFRLTSSAYLKVKAFRNVSPFAVTVDKQVIYYGFFILPISSFSCDNSIIMDISWNSPNAISVKLGYPSLLPGASIDDQRNNPKLIAALKKQGKLK